MTHGRIVQNPKVMVGKPVIRGTRITVELILRQLSEDWSEEMILDGYPNLQREDIHAALAFAADVLRKMNILETGERAPAEMS